MKIKTEPEIQHSLGIKVESNDHQSEDNKNINILTTDTFAQEKQKLLEAFGSLKTENQKLTFELKAKHDECAKFCLEKNKLAEDVANANASVKDIELQLTQVSETFSKKSEEYEQKLSNLLHENQLLLARLKQFQTGIAQRESITKSTVDKNKENIYEVEEILADKMKRNVRYFLVRWKGFDAKSDTWERETNLMCPAILKKYLGAKQN